MNEEKKNIFNIATIKSFKHIINDFCSIFLVFYFFSLEPNTIIPLATYKLILYISVLAVIYLCRNKVKQGNKMRFIRLGFAFNVVYFFAIILLKEQVIQYAWLIGMLYGIMEGLYYSAYNVIESQIVSREKRASYAGVTGIINSILSLLLPILIGWLLTIYTYDNLSILLVILVLLGILLSLRLKVETENTAKKCNLKAFFNKLKTQEYYGEKKVMQNQILNGFVLSGGAVTSIMSLYLVGILDSSTSVGYSTAFFALFAILSGVVFAKLIKPKNYHIFMLISGFTYAVSIVLFIFSKNIYTLFFYNITNSLLITLFNNILNKTTFDYSRKAEIQKLYKMEYFLTVEIMLFIGRCSSYILMILLGLFYSETMLIVLVILFAIAMIALTIMQSTLEKSTYNKTDYS